MQFFRKWLFAFALMFTAANATYADTHRSIQVAIENGLHYLESVQSEYGEFPTTFKPNIPEPQRSLKASYDSNLFTTAMLADALHSIHSPRVERIQKKTVDFLQSQLNNKKGLWSYFTTHNPHPFYPTTIYDLDDTAFASMVLQQNNVAFPDNRAAINANKNESGVYLTFVLPPSTNSIDCGVNANVLSYLQENDPKVCSYLNDQVTRGNNCAVYYTLLDAYYLIGRAYASGVSCLQPSVTPITNYVLAQFNAENGDVEKSPFKTAIALNTLLSLGYQGPIIPKAMQYLLQTQSVENGSWPAEDFWLWAGKDRNGNPIMLGRSSSSALTTAIVLKALNILQAKS